ncbi:MAG: Trk-type K+ transport system, membrane component [Candidatus Methanohalarchaeum thermophilum]|uniref:Trk-type K+ transport system, membrane component n=1 Tax=Methanohalarchaeum thermophilum TaxID=1903181 RepID=A0A1Q6DSZ0_METT1|nr:MAG: Trk-type K+ transport system, membrane component [Candidatus Methanohalarchaeum thermophilum]
MNRGAVARDVGSLLVILSLLFFVSCLVSLGLGEFYGLVCFLVPGGLVYPVGYFFRRYFSEAGAPDKVDSMATAAVGWFLVSLFGGLPFWILATLINYDLGFLGLPELSKTLAVYSNPVNGFFESVAGFTGTGLTVTLNESSLPGCLQWWRSLTQWVGGVGVIVLTTAILKRPGSGSFTLYESEARSEKIHPSVVSTVRSIWWIILAYTILGVLVFYFAGMPPWDAVNHAMTGITTGGFSVKDQSLATYNSPLIEAAAIPIMVLGGIAFTTHYKLLGEKNPRKFITDVQTQWFLLIISIGVTALMAIFFLKNTYNGFLGILRVSVFQFISAATCTGFQTATDLGVKWPIASHLVITVGMIVGGVAGSTAGGIKVIRSITIIKGLRYELNSLIYPKTAIRKLKIGKRKLYDEQATKEIQEALTITFLWILLLFIGIIILSLTTNTQQFTLQNIIFEVVSAQGNVGLSTGITTPQLHPIPKLTLIANMLIGRLEIIPIIIFIQALLTKK